MRETVRLFQPTVGEEELQAVEECFDRSWLGLGPKVKEFEEHWKSYLGCTSAFAVNSGTAALHLALSAFGFQAGMKVLVPALTFSATASAVLYNNLIPVFVDSDPENLAMSLEDLEKKYSDDCVAIIVVHFAGHPAPMEHIVPWARDKGLKVIEDCAHTAGDNYLNLPLGRWGDVGCFSFEEKKLMTTGDGGMICSDDPLLLQNIPARRWVGIDKDTWKSSKSYVDDLSSTMHWYYEISELGYKYNMNDLSAAIGIEQLKKLPKMNRRRAEIINRYLKALPASDRVRPLLSYNPELYSYWLFGLRVEDKHSTMLKFKNEGIATGSHYTPLTQQPLFKKFGQSCPVVEKEFLGFVTLPLHASLTSNEVERVVQVIENL